MSFSTVSTPSRNVMDMATAMDMAMEMATVMTHGRKRAYGDE